MAGSGDVTVSHQQSPPVLVVGAHRSGTSAVTGALGALGLAVPVEGDRMEWVESNPEHWESLSLSLHNEALLNRLDGSWDGPPDPAEGWDNSSEIRGVADPAPLIAAAFPEPGPFVWKDPRVCLLLPYWRRRLAEPIAAVLVWRSPMAVARSLATRDKMSLASGLAIWERYNRSALHGLDGVDTYVVEYESVVKDPEAFVDAVAGWLSSLPQLEDHADRWDRAGAVDSIDAGLWHQTGAPPEEPGGLLLDGYLQLAEYLASINGGHRPLHPRPPAVESAWPAALIEVRRELGRQRRDLRARADALDAVGEELRVAREELRVAREELATTRAELSRTAEELAQRDLSLTRAIARIENMQSSTSWRLTKPVRTVASSLHGVRGNPPSRPPS
jgi:hypothetical protein